MNLDELTKDLEEAQRLLAGSSRPRLQQLLSNEVQRIQKVIGDLKKPQTTAPTATAASSTNVRPTTKITTYAWDQSNDFLKLYVNVPGTLPGEETGIRLDVNARSVDLHAENIGGKDYYFTVKGLLQPVVPETSRFKVKKDEVVLLIKKQDTGENWESVTEAEQLDKDKKKPKGNDMMSMMKQMYDDGDDETKRSIKKAWFEAQEKKKMTGEDMLDM